MLLNSQQSHVNFSISKKKNVMGYLRPTPLECLPKYADTGLGVGGKDIPDKLIDELKRDEEDVDGGTEYCSVREGVEIGDET
jgi:hypothetical protein